METGFPIPTCRHEGSGAGRHRTAKMLMRRFRILCVFLWMFPSACRSDLPVHLREIFHSRTPGWAHDVALYGERIYVSDRQGGYSTFDRLGTGTERTFSLGFQDVISLSPNSGTPILAAGLEGLAWFSPADKIIQRLASGSIVNAVAVRAGIAYIANGPRGLTVAQLKPGPPRFLASVPTSGCSRYPLKPESCADG